jgi:hypothetical protein
MYAARLTYVTSSKLICMIRFLFLFFLPPYSVLLFRVGFRVVVQTLFIQVSACISKVI